ncbi:MAG: hypothetical protein Q7S00_08020 [bacterium]|nr:hypothetical protein [bacterium]
MKFFFSVVFSLFFIFPIFLSAQEVTTVATELAAPGPLPLIFSGFHDFRSFEEVKTLIQKTEGVLSLTPRTIKKDLMEYDLRTTGDLHALYRSFQNQFSEKAWVKLKESPSGPVVIEIAAR